MFLISIGQPGPCPFCIQGSRVVFLSGCQPLLPCQKYCHCWQQPEKRANSSYIFISYLTSASDSMSSSTGFLIDVSNLQRAAWAVWSIFTDIIEQSGKQLIVYIFWNIKRLTNRTGEWTINCLRFNSNLSVLDQSSTSFLGSKNPVQAAVALALGPICPSCRFSCDVVFLTWFEVRLLSPVQLE